MKRLDGRDSCFYSSHGPAIRESDHFSAYFAVRSSRPLQSQLPAFPSPMAVVMTRLLVPLCCLFLSLPCFAKLPNIVVFYTDDHGYADLGCQRVLDDIKTPHIDALAGSGVRALHGYTTAPQCVPSRAGLLIGKFQSRFGVETNGDSLDGFDAEETIAERLKRAGYATAQFGKWHLGPTPKITDHGFDHVFAQNAQRPFSANITLDGDDRPMGELRPTLYHVDGCSKAAASIIRRYRDQPFFLYIAYRAPHVPLDAPPKYLKRFPGEMPERRRQALAMISATDDGVGLITKTLKQCGLSEKTLIFYIADNGAPLKIHKADTPGPGAGWDGSLNDPLNGEKGMLSEGGMHVPFVISWPGKISAGQQYPHPVSTLDVAATAVASAGLEKNSALDGVDLLPFLSGEDSAPPHDSLAWRWGAQSAIREGQWKLLRGGEREYLYDLATDLEEKHSVLPDHPAVANRLRGKLQSWTQELSPPGLATRPMSSVWDAYFDFYLEGKPAPPLREKNSSRRAGNSRDDPTVHGWLARKGTLRAMDDGVVFESNGGFIARSGLKLKGPLVLEVELKTSKPGPIVVSWRCKGDGDFDRENQSKAMAKGDGQLHTVRLEVPSAEEVIHLRLNVPGKRTEIDSIVAKQSNGAGKQLLELPK